MISTYNIQIDNINCLLEISNKKMKSVRLSVIFDSTRNKIVIRVHGYKINYDYAMKMINDHYDWVHKRVLDNVKKNDIFNLEDVNDLKIIYLYGIPYEVVITNNKNKHLKIIDNILYYYSSKGYIVSKPKALEFIRNAYLYKITELFNHYNKVFHRNSELNYKSMKSRHGYCLYKENKIVLSSHLVHIPLYAIEYVIIHEFCHFTVPNHSKLFYEEVEKYCKDYKERIKVLKKYNVLTI